MEVNHGKSAYVGIRSQPVASKGYKHSKGALFGEREVGDPRVKEGRSSGGFRGVQGSGRVGRA